ncbi:beta strand repeat-containing protein [Gemmatimonas sp.]|uniref:beta strand repeat-containing protein n=1 Tax=Gemmatimonas sp. TaxID=1962908 RepID=UPI0037C09124
MHSSPSSSRTLLPSVLRRFRATTLALGLLACGGGGDASGPPVVVNPPTVRSVAITPTVATIRVGETQSLSAVVDAINGAGTGVTWSSESPTVVSVSSTGLVTAIAIGTGTIRATSAADTRVSATATITVQAARNISLTPTTVSLGAGQTQALQATVQIDPGLPTTVTWRTSAATVATVSAAGVVAGVALGTATITAVSVGDTTLRATATVNVVPIVRAVAVTPITASLFINGTQQLSATVTADAGAAQTVTWRSSNPAAATVSATGLVTAVGLGSAAITVLSTADTTRRATSAITVAPRPLTVSITPRNVGLNPGTSTTFAAVVSADPGVPTGVTWSSSTGTVATINAQGVVSAISLGSTVITATSVADATKRDTVTVNVVPRLATAWSATRLGGVLRDDLLSIFTVGAANVFAIDMLGDIYRWNGTAWTLSLSGSADYVALHGSSGTNIIAVGTNGAIARWNGTAWSTMTSGTTQTLNAIWVESPTVAWAAGNNGTVLQLATNTWSTETTNSTQPLNGVWGGDNVVYAVGANSEVRRRTGGTWSRVTVPSAELLYGVHGNNASDVVIVGTNGTLLRWNGTAWAVLSVGGLAGDLYQVSGSAANGGRRYLVGDGGVAQLDGNTATLISTPYAPQLFGVSVDVTGTVWASGERGAVLRSADGGGSTWTTNNLAPDLLDVWSTAANNAFAVGEFGFVYRWNGSTWTKMTTPTQATLTSVWATATGDGFIGGESGTMLRLTGGAWVPMAFPSVSTVSAVWGTNGANVYATTKAGEILRFNGSAWTLLTTATAPLWALYGASAADVFAAGENGAVWRLTGNVFTALPAPAIGTLGGIWLTSATNVFTDGANSSGDAGIASRYNGTEWTSLQPGTTSALTALWGPSEFDLYATGDNGTLLRFNGNSWTSMATGTTDLLWSVSGAPNATAGFAVGINSTVVAASGGTGFRAASRAAADAWTPGSLEPSAAARLRRGPHPHGAARKRKTAR